MHSTSSPVSYEWPPAMEDEHRFENFEIFDEYFKRVADEAAKEEEEGEEGGGEGRHEGNSEGVPGAFEVPKNQTRRISAPVHRLQGDVGETKRQRRSQSMRHCAAHEARPRHSMPDGDLARSSSYRNRNFLLGAKRDEEKSKARDDDPVDKKLRLVKLMQDLDCTVVRTFVTSPRGLVNRGDSFKTRRSPDSSEALPGRNQDKISPSLGLTGTNGFGSSGLAPDVARRPSSVRKVLVMGDHGVGKTSLLQQFITSEYMGTADPVFDNELEKTVSVQVDDVETTLTFVDLPTDAQKEWRQHAEVEAFVVCYSVTDRRSFDFAVDLLCEMKQKSFDAAVIVVANKSDLVRTRKVSFEEGKSLCQKCSCKFVEVSAAFNHYVDELLVGLVQQIRLNPTRRRARSVPNTGLNSSTAALLSFKALSFSCFKGARVFLSEFLFGSRKTKFRSCDNLWSL